MFADNTAERAKTVSFQEDPLFSKKYTQLVPVTQFSVEYVTNLFFLHVESNLL